jgi:hypothetical protein
VPPGSTPSPSDDLDDGHFSLSLYGASATLDCHVPRLHGRLDWLLGEFRNPDVSAGGRQAKPNSVAGSIAPFDLELATQRAPSVLRRWEHRGDELVTLFQDGEHFWMLDERWGLCQMDLLRGAWRSWVLPRARVHPMRGAELAALWPLAQLLRGRGVHLVPAASVARGNWGALLLCPYPIERELTLLVRHGYRLIGQRWTAIVERGGRPVLLHMPGWVERPDHRGRRVGAESPAGRRALGRRRSAWLGRMRPMGPAGRIGMPEEVECVDLTGSDCLSDGHTADWQAAAPCDAVVIVHSGRLTEASCSDLRPSDAAAEIRRAWPIPDLHPTRVASPLPLRLAATSQCARLQLGRNPAGLVRLLDDLRGAARPAPPKLTLSHLLPPRAAPNGRVEHAPKLSLPPVR